MLSKEIWESGPKSQLGMRLKKCPCTVGIRKATLHYRHKDTCLYSMTTQGWDNITYHSSNKSEHTSNTVQSYTQNDHCNDEQTLDFPTFWWHEIWFSDETNTLRWKQQPSAYYADCLLQSLQAVLLTPQYTEEHNLLSMANQGNINSFVTNTFNVTWQTEHNTHR